MVLIWYPIGKIFLTDLYYSDLLMEDDIVMGGRGGGGGGRG